MNCVTSAFTWKPCASWIAARNQCAWKVASPPHPRTMVVLCCVVLCRWLVHTRRFKGAAEHLAQREAELAAAAAKMAEMEAKLNKAMAEVMTKTSVINALKSKNRKLDAQCVVWWRRFIACRWHPHSRRVTVAVPVPVCVCGQAVDRKEGAQGAHECHGQPRPCQHGCLRGRCCHP